MDKKSKVISGLKAKKIIIRKPNKYFNDSEKHQIIQELLNSGCTKQEIWEKYTGQQEEHGQLLRWMRQLGYDDSVKTRRPNFTANNDTIMAKKTTPTEKIIEDFETLQLKKKNSRTGITAQRCRDESHCFFYNGGHCRTGV